MTSKNQEPREEKSLGYDDRGNRVIGNADTGASVNIDFRRCAFLSDEELRTDVGDPVAEAEAAIGDCWDHSIQNLPEQTEAPVVIDYAREGRITDVVDSKLIVAEADRRIAEARVAAEPAIKLTRRHERMARPPKVWMIGGVALVGPQVGLMFGRRGLEKTFMLVGLSLSLINDHPDWMGLPLQRRADQPDAVIVLGEGTAGFADREQAWLQAYGGSADNLITIDQESVGLTTAAGLARFVRSLRDENVKPCQIVFDTQGLTCAAGVDENSRSDMRAVYANLKLLAKEFDCTVIAVTHPGNDPKNWGRPAGASSQEQDADFMLNLRHSKRRGKHVIVEKVKEGKIGWGWTYRSRPVADALVVDFGERFTFDPAGGSDDDHGTVGGPGDSAGVVELVKGLAVFKAIEADPGISQARLCVALNMHRDEVAPLREMLVERGVIRVDGGGVGKPAKHYVIAPWALLLGGDDDAE